MTTVRVPHDALVSASRWALRRLSAGHRAPADLWMAAAGEGRVAAVSSDLLEALGWSADEVIGSPWFELWCRPEQSELARGHLELAIIDSIAEPRTVELSLRCRDGSELVVEWTVQARRTASGRVSAVLCTGGDVTRRAIAERERDDLETVAAMVSDMVAIATHHARHDRLTGLFNQAAFEDATGVALRAASDRDGRMAIMLVNLDRFSSLTDTLGYDSSNRLLQLAGTRLVEVAEEGGVVARWGGDEFAILLGDVSTHAAAEAAADAVVDALRRPFELDGSELRVTGSVGLAVYPAYGDNPATLIANAGLAMRDAKRHGGDSARKYRSALGLRAFERLRLEHQLQYALARGEIAMHYQPVVELAAGRVIGVEALMRWTHPTLGAVPPSAFIPLAEDSALISALGRFALQSACHQSADWLRAGLPPLRTSVNVSARQLSQPGLVADVGDALAASDLPPGLVELEITESAALQDGEATGEVLSQLCGLGVSIALDDFGCGFSPLLNISRLPIAAIKIDRSFTSALPDESGAGALAVSLISLAHRLRVRVVAEGVETVSQMERLRDEGCDDAQGYYFSEAVSASDALDLLGRRWISPRPNPVRSQGWRAAEMRQTAASAN